MLVALAAALALPLGAMAAPKVAKDWKKAAKKLKSAVIAEAKADYALAQARAYTLDEEDADELLEEAKEEAREAKGLAKDQFDARMDLAEELGETEGIYSVDIDPMDFVGVIDNPLMPLSPGDTRTFEATTEEGEEVIEIEVLNETIEILGVTCRVVRDTVYVDEEMVEDTRDYFAQDVSGNVWYFGEISLNYEDGRLVDVDGSWMAGVDGALPGIVMPAMPQVGDIYRQEFLLGEAEDYGSVLALAETVTVPAGVFTNCLKTFDATPLEPEEGENKYYAPGVGLVLEVDIETGDRVELTEIGD
jgi:hypothetical protein